MRCDLIMQHKEKTDKIEQKINQLKAQKQAILAREKEKERKARTIRLIQIGAIIENIGIDNIELANKFKSYFEDNDKSKTWLEKFINENKWLIS